MTTNACNMVEEGSTVLTLKPDVKLCLARDGSEGHGGLGWASTLAYQLE